MGDQLGTSIDTALSYVPRRVFERVQSSVTDVLRRAQLMAELCRINVLYMIARAGSGHIGSSFSSLEIMTWLLSAELDAHAPNRRGALYFSSKGHDAPAYYALLIALGHLPESELHALRRLHGLPGHPDVGTPGVLANTGSLGMGVSKAKGMIRAQRGLGDPRRVFVLTGDGELQEGQFWESLVSAVNDRMSELTVIIDRNGLQSDAHVADTSDLGDLHAKLQSFGVRVSKIDGHSLPALASALAPHDSAPPVPHVIIADTIKGRGVSFMEATGVPHGQLYRFHSGAPTPAHYAAALSELHARCSAAFERLGLGELTLCEQAATPAARKPSARRMTEVYGELLLERMAERPELYVLDADLAVDLGIRPIRERYPERFVECGIAEMDMVSQAGGLALRGALPIVHSFACFLSARPNEHIYNNASERTKIIYTAALGGLLPAAPGHSHQGVRDLAALSGIPDLALIAPCDETELTLALDYALRAPHSTYLRLCSLPWELPRELPPAAAIVPGCGSRLRHGDDGLVIAYGPVMLSQAFLAAEQVSERFGIELAVVSLPWLNRIDPVWLAEQVGERPWLFCIDDHYVAGGQGQLVAATLMESGAYVPRLRRYGLRELPACGAAQEVLAHHGLDADSLARDFAACYGGPRTRLTQSTSDAAVGG